MKKDEKARIAKQKNALGEEGLKRLEKKLADAKAENDKEIPKGLLEGFRIPSTDSVHFIHTITARSGAARKQFGRPNGRIQDLVEKDGSDLPLFVHFEHILTNFVHLSLIMNTGSVPVELRPLLSVYLENFFNTPIEREGKRIEFEQVVIELEKDTVSYGIDAGSSLAAPEVIQISMQVEPEKYSTAIRWLKELLWDSVFDEERLKATTARLLADVPDEKRSGHSMVYAIDTMIHTAPTSISRARNTLVKALYLRRIQRLLSSSPQTVLDHLSTIRSSLLSFPNLRVLVVANLETLPHPVSAWTNFTAALPNTSTALAPIDTRFSRLSPAGLSPGKLSYITPLPTIDSSFLLATTRGPQTYTDPLLPALMVAVAYLDAVEGPLWSAVRGTGLAYGTSFTRSVDSGLVQFDVYRSPDAWKAFDVARTVVEEFVRGERKFEITALEGAVSTIVVGFANEGMTAKVAAERSFVRQVVRGLEDGWNEKMLRKVRAVTVEQVKGVMEQLLLPVFLPGSADVVVACAPVMEEVSWLARDREIGGRSWLADCRWALV